MSPDSSTRSQDDAQQTLSAERLAEIKLKLETGYCNPFWRDHIVTLIDEVERLQSLFDLAVERQQKRQKKEG